MTNETWRIQWERPSRPVKRARAVTHIWRVLDCDNAIHASHKAWEYALSGWLVGRPTEDRSTRRWTVPLCKERGPFVSCPRCLGRQVECRLCHLQPIPQSLADDFTKLGKRRWSLTKKEADEMREQHGLSLSSEEQRAASGTMTLNPSPDRGGGSVVFPSFTDSDKDGGLQYFIPNTGEPVTWADLKQRAAKLGSAGSLNFWTPNSEITFRIYLDPIFKGFVLRWFLPVERRSGVFLDNRVRSDNLDDFRSRILDLVEQEQKEKQWTDRAWAAIVDHPALRDSKLALTFSGVLYKSGWLGKAQEVLLDIVRMAYGPHLIEVGPGPEAFGSSRAHALHFLGSDLPPMYRESRSELLVAALEHATDLARRAKESRS